MVYDDVISVLDTAEDESGVLRVLQYILRGVYLERSSGVTIDEAGEKRAYNCTLFVPESVQSEDSYIKPKAWERLSYSEKMHKYTFRPQQVLVLTGESLVYDSLSAVLNSEDDCYQVVGVDYLDKVLPHFEVLGK